MNEDYRDETTEPSKSQRKREAEALQKLGSELLEAPETDWATLDLPDDLLDALHEARRIHSHGAQKRHLQYIGKLMRGIDPETINNYLQQRRLNKNRAAQAHHALEKLRDRLIAEGEPALTEFMASHPRASAKQVSHFIRQAHREREAGHPPKSARALFRYLKEVTGNTL